MKCPHCSKKIKKTELVSPEVKIEQNNMERKLKRARRMYNKNINIFIGKKLDATTENLFFSRELDAHSVTVHYKTDVWLSTVMRDIGVFGSVAEAKGAGWHKKADKGFKSILLKGKTPHRVCIYKTLVNDGAKNSLHP